MTKEMRGFGDFGDLQMRVLSASEGYGGVTWGKMG